MKEIHILGGGTFSHVRNHLSLAVPAFGSTAKHLYNVFNQAILDDCRLRVDSKLHDYIVMRPHLTKMADPYNSNLVTNEDVSELVDKLIADPNTKVIIFNAAICDFDGTINDVKSGKYAPRLQSRNTWPTIFLAPSEKIITRIRKERKDIFLVAFKTTCGATEQEQYVAGLNLLKENSCNLVVANDTKTHLNMIIVPEEAKYCVTTDRQKVLNELAEITLLRCHLTYTRSTVIPGKSISWDNDVIPTTLHTVVDYCISKGAYKPFRGNTAGHFAVKDLIVPGVFYTSKRSTNFNDLDKIGLVEVHSNNRTEVTAFGAKPSVGGMSQRIIFDEHPEMDCIVHFHCPLKHDRLDVAIAEQFPFECGSHECGQNTSDHLFESVPGIKAVMLDQHGPNIVFNRNTAANLVIKFIDDNFDLSQKTGGLFN